MNYLCKHSVLMLDLVSFIKAKILNIQFGEKEKKNCRNIQLKYKVKIINLFILSCQYVTSTWCFQRIKKEKGVEKQTNRHISQYIPSGKVTRMLQLAIKKKKRAKQTDK